MGVTIRESFSKRRCAVDLSRLMSLFRCRSLKESIETRDNNYTVVRFFLSASVIFFHAFALSGNKTLHNPTNRFLWPVTDMGGLAVGLFFFLSGLFVSQSYLGDPNIFRFVAKRFLRIFPGLFVCLLVTSILAVLFDDPRHAILHFTSASFYKYITDNARLHLNWFISGIFSNHSYQAINGSIHTLPLEWKMYMIMAAASGLGFLGSRRLIAGTALILIMVALAPPSFTVGANFIFDADYSRSAGALFFLGMLAFSLSRLIYVPWWCAVGLSCAALLTNGTAHIALFYLTAVGWTIYLGEARWLTRLIQPRTDLSYGIYIYGWPIQQIILTIFGRNLGPYQLTLAALPVAAMFAFASWHLIERPAIRVGHGLNRMKEFTLRQPGMPALLTVILLFILCLTALYAAAK
ncbi:MAG: acyltransferase [Rhodospirillales bacterium]|nr:acyltransferase [Rhodospirillales bacterium]